MALEDEIISGNRSSLDGQRLLLPSINRPTDFAPVPSISTQNRVSTPAMSPFQKGASALQAGLSASQNTAVNDSLEAGVQVGASTLAGGLAGAAVGGPVGAAVGAGGALLTSSINAWLSLRANKRRARALEALKKESQEREEAMKAENLKHDAYQARLQANQGAAAAYDKNANALQAMMVNNINLRKLYLQGAI